MLKIEVFYIYLQYIYIYIKNLFTFVVPKPYQYLQGKCNFYVKGV